MIIKYSKQDIARWKNKELLKEWESKFPNLISDHLYDILVKRKELNTYCFGELFTGAYFYEKGYKILYEPWLENCLFQESIKLKGLRNRFLEIMSKAIGPEKFKAFSGGLKKKKIEKGQPDLFVYNNKDHFFVEVKREGDKISEEQEKFIGIAKVFGITVRIVNLRLKDSF